MIDYLIVGGGLAGIAFAEEARKNGMRFKLINGARPCASIVAGGIYNPIVLKRLTKVQNAEVYLPKMNQFFEGILQYVGVDYRQPLKIYRRFSSIAEQNDWFAASDKFPQFLRPTIIRIANPAISAQFGFGEVINSGFVDAARFVSDYLNLLAENECLITEDFDYNRLSVNSGNISYKSHSTRHIVFAEGMGLKQNPLFNELPLQGTKGELLIVRIPGLDMKEMIKAGVFIMPLGSDLYKVGSTYDWTDKSETPTSKAKAELLANFEEVVKCPYEVVSHLAGIRPTVKDRKPLVGTHRKWQNVHVLNGLGSRGVMLAPALAAALIQSIENGTTLPADINISRFDDVR